MAALWPSHIMPPVFEGFYHAKTGMQKDFTMKICLGDIVGGTLTSQIVDMRRLAFNELKVQCVTAKWNSESLIRDYCSCSKISS